MRLKRTILLFFIISLLAFLSFSENLNDILKKNYSTRGGIDKLKAIKTMFIKAKMSSPMGGGNEIQMKMWFKKPSMIRTEIIFQGQKIVQAYDGKTVWGIIPFLGTDKPIVLTGEQEKQVKQMVDSFEDPLIYYKEKGYKLEFLGTEDFEGTKVYKLKLTKKDGKIVYIYLDEETGIEIKAFTTVKKGNEEINVETIFSDYKEVQGLLFPFYIESKMGGKTVSQITVETMKLNFPIKDEFFKMPESK